MSNDDAKPKTLLAAYGCIAMGVLLMLMSAGHVFGAFLTSKANLIGLTAEFADRPALFAVLVTIWAGLAVGGMIYTVQSVAEVRTLMRRKLETTS